MHTLSKSDFKLACTCPTKLYYKELGYPATGDDDPYLRLLADGGYMVEEIARILHEPEGRALPFHSGTRDAARATTEALAAPNATLFEATLLNGIKVARVDILVKRGDAFEIIEVKSKSYDGAAAAGDKPVFRGRNGQIKAEWEEYLLDVAYQVHLLLELSPVRDGASLPHDARQVEDDGTRGHPPAVHADAHAARHGHLRPHRGGLHRRPRGAQGEQLPLEGGCHRRGQRVCWTSSASVRPRSR